MKTINCIGWIACLAVILSCGAGPEKKYTSAVEKYRIEPSKKNELLLQEALVGLVTLEKFSPGAASSDGIVFTGSGESVTVHRPIDISVNVPQGYIAASCGEEAGCAFSTGEEALLFNARGSKTGMLKGSSRDGITGLLVSPEKVVFLKGESLYESSWSGEDVIKIVGGDVVTPPGTGIAPRALIMGAAGRYAVNAGNAGMYSLSVVDTIAKTVTLKNFSNASRKFYFNGTNVFCITGATGNWTLVKYDIVAKKQEALWRFSVLKDVEFCDGFLVAVKDEGVHLFDYSGKDDIVVPFPCDLAGRAGNHPVFKVKDALHLVDHKLLFEKLTALQRDIPELFTVR